MTGATLLHFVFFVAFGTIFSMDAATLKELETTLQKEHDELVRELKSIAIPNPRIKGDWNARFPAFGESETGSHSSLDEEADEVEEYEIRLEAEHSLESRLLQVNNALERIKKGTYGMCARCGKEIPLERLRANPSAEFHMEHA